MRASTLPLLLCPDCQGELALKDGRPQNDAEIATGSVSCANCRASYPILSGVLILVPDVRGYLLEHAKGIAREVADEAIPKEHRAAFAKARRALSTEHIEEDLEAERVNALYLMNHYLKANEVASPDPVIRELIQKHWDAGPFARIRERLASGSAKRAAGARKPSLVELGCGVGGLWAALQGTLGSYLGLDSSFASIALARHLALGTPLRQKNLRVPDDLLLGPVSREVRLKPAPRNAGATDFVVCELGHPPLKRKCWDLAAALNVLDMLADPSALPRLQFELLTKDGIAIQSCPYIWHPGVAEQLREDLPRQIRTSDQAVEWLYMQSGFKIDSVEPHVPWLFFKHIRQLELYSVHLFFASK